MTSFLEVFQKLLIEEILYADHKPATKRYHGVNKYLMTW